MQEMQKLQQQPTIEQVLKFLKDNRAKSFVLDIETDSTIIADENAEKQRRTEFVQMLGGLMQQLGAMVAADPANAKFCGEVLKFSVAPFRASRQLDGAIDEMVERMETKGAQGKGDDPTTAMGKIQLQIEQMKQQTAQQKIQQDMQIAQAKLQQDDAHKQAELANQRQIAQMKMRATARTRRSTWRCRVRRCRKAARRTRRNWRLTRRRWSWSGRRRRCRRKVI